MHYPQAVREYIEQIIIQQDIDPDTPEGQELALLLYHELDRFTKEYIVNALPTDKLEEFARLTKNQASSQTLQFFAQNHISDLEGVFTKAFIKFSNFYLRKEVAHAKS